MAIYHKGKKTSILLHEGSIIKQIYHMGKKYLKEWLSLTTKASISLAFGEEATQVIKSTNAYLETIAITDAQRAKTLASFINEYPLLVTSLVETSKTRWLVGDGKAWIELDYSPNNYTNCKVDAQFTTMPESSTWPCILGACDSGELNRWCIMLHGSNKQFIYAVCDNISSSNQKTIRTNWADLLPHKFIVNNGEFIIDGLSYGSIEVPTFNTNNRMRVFGENNTSNPSARIRPVNIGSCEISDNDTSIHLTPFIRNGENGMLDILSGTFYPNANTSGQFTIELTNK